MSINMNKKKPILLAFLIFTAVFLSMNITHGKKIQVDSLVLNKADVNKLVGQIEFDPLKKRYIVDDKIITTNIDYKLQKIIEIELKSKQRLNRGKPLEVVIRAIDPNSGNVLLAANFVKDKPVKFTTLYPAASLFKIISAAAIIDKYGYKANTPFYYNGGSHTLYKSQLKNKKNRYTNRTSLSSAFAKSVNPVFGKIGNILGADSLKRYSDIFGFNEKIKSDFYFRSGKIKSIKRPYHVAETASGFNRETEITPLFGSILSSVIVNNGKIYEPHLVKDVQDSNGNMLYESKPVVHKDILRGRTFNTLNRLMVNTVKSGTARKIFRKVRRDKLMKRLIIGGKTGSINNRNNKIRYDWFAGFAKDKNGNNSIAISVLVMHGKYIGKRSGEYAYLVIKKFFEGRNV